MLTKRIRLSCSSTPEGAQKSRFAKRQWNQIRGLATVGGAYGERAEPGLNARRTVRSARRARGVENRPGIPTSRARLLAFSRRFA
jgi:hypothetical protein